MSRSLPNVVALELRRRFSLLTRNRYILKTDGVIVIVSETTIIKWNNIILMRNIMESKDTVFELFGNQFQFKYKLSLAHLFNY